MNLWPPPAFHLPQALGLFLLSGLVPTVFAEPSRDDIAPSQTRLVLAQVASGSAPAVSSQAVQNQPQVPVRAGESLPPAPSPAPTAPPPEKEKGIMDPRLDLTRPKNCQLDVTTEQTIVCGTLQVVIPAGTYEQRTIVENPEAKRAIGETPLKPQQVGLGYIRYLSDVPLKINGVERTGGIDVPIREEDNLPVRIWYRKMVEPDPVTKAFSFILPPVALAAGLGAWSSGNTLLPDSPPVFTEARDYDLKPIKPKPNLNEIPKPSHVRPLTDPYATSSSQIRSK